MAIIGTGLRSVRRVDEYGYATLRYGTLPLRQGWPYLHGVFGHEVAVFRRFPSRRAAKTSGTAMDDDIREDIHMPMPYARSD